MKKRILSGVLFWLIPLNIYAVVFGGSNLGLFGYPSHSCFKPTKPFKPYSLDSQWEVDIYNIEVDFYNSQLQQYSSCIDVYIESANNDIKRIKEKAQEAIDDASYLP